MAVEIVHKQEQGTESFAYVALLSAGFHVVLVFLKFGLGVFSGSIALKADAFHSLADLLSSLTIYVGIKISERKSQTFPYGLYKAENLTALVTSLVIFFAAYEIMKEVVHCDPAYVISNTPVAILGLAGIVALIFAFSRYEMRIGRKAGSPSIVADAKHIRTDLLSTGAILIGLLGSLVGWHIDRYVAVIIAVLMVRLGATILLDSLKVLLDASISNDMLDQIQKVFYEFPPVKEVKRLSGRCSGRFKFVEAEVTLNVETLKEAHDISSFIEEHVYDCFPEVDKLLIHCEPTEDQVKSCATQCFSPYVKTSVTH
ncbi:cation diffusion facilitator family transporter [Candidatus Hydrogenedentota bacterium]